MALTPRQYWQSLHLMYRVLFAGITSWSCSTGTIPAGIIRWSCSPQLCAVPVAASHHIGYDAKGMQKGSARYLLGHHPNTL
jgi:hypothetical protein